LCWAVGLLGGTEILRKVWTYVFVTTREPRKVVLSIRKIRGVVRADALFSTPDVIVLVEGSDIATMDAVIDKIALVPKVQGTDSKVARWIQ
jgi:hypothetical protein